MRLVAFASLLVAAACASSPATSSTSAPQTVRSGNAGMGSLTMAAVTDAGVTNIAWPVEDVFLALASAFDSLAIPKALLDPKGHVIGSEGFKIRQRLGKTPLSRFIDCGQTQIGPNADSYEVYMTITSRVEAAPGGKGSRLITTVEASARPLQFRQDYSRCPTKGTLEVKIADVVKARLQ